MRRHPIAFALFMACGIAAASLGIHTQDADASDGQSMLQAQALDRAPETRMEAVAAMDSALAAAVIGAVAGQFDEDAVAVKLDGVDVTAASFRERALQGRGQIRIGDGTEWIPFEFAALYDTGTGTASYPRLTIGAGDASETLALDSTAAVSLATRTRTLIADEFPGQPVELTLVDLRGSPAGPRHTRIDGSGTVEFGSDGSAAARIHGLYDPNAGRWLQVRYELGAAPESVAPGEAASVSAPLAIR